MVMDDEVSYDSNKARKSPVLNETNMDYTEQTATNENAVAAHIPTPRQDDGEEKDADRVVSKKASSDETESTTRIHVDNKVSGDIEASEATVSSRSNDGEDTDSNANLITSSVNESEEDDRINEGIDEAIKTAWEEMPLRVRYDPKLIWRSFKAVSVNAVWLLGVGGYYVYNAHIQEQQDVKPSNNYIGGYVTGSIGILLGIGNPIISWYNSCESKRESFKNSIEDSIEFLKEEKKISFDPKESDLKGFIERAVLKYKKSTLKYGNNFNQNHFRKYLLGYSKQRSEAL